MQGAINIEPNKGIAGADLACFTRAADLDTFTQRGRLSATLADEAMTEWLYDAKPPLPFSEPVVGKH